MYYAWVTETWREVLKYIVAIGEGSLVVHMKYLTEAINLIA